MLLLVLFCTPAANAQSYSKGDSIKMHKLLASADEEAVTGSLDNAMQYTQQALQWSREKKMLRGEGFARLKEADIAIQQSNTAKVDHLIEEGTRIAYQLRDSFMLALASYQQGQSQMYNEQYTSAEKLFLKALSLHFESNKSPYTGLVYNDLGYMFGVQGEFEQQAKWLLKAMRVYEEVQDLPGLTTVNSNLASVYYSLGNRIEAMNYTWKAIATREKVGDIAGLATSYSNLSIFFRQTSIDSSIKYQEIATRYAEKTGVKAKLIPGYDNMSVLMNMQKRKVEALDYIKRSILLCRELNDKLGLANKTRWAALLCGDLKDTTAGLAYLRESYQLSEELNNKALWRDFYVSKSAYYKNRVTIKMPTMK